MRPSTGDLGTESRLEDGSVANQSLLLGTSVNHDQDKTLIANEITRFINDKPEVGEWTQADVEDWLERSGVSKL